MAVGAIIVAAGRSERMGGVDKLLMPLAGEAVLVRSVTVFAAHPDVDTIVVVTSEANEAVVRELLAPLAPKAIVVTGGSRRRDSVLNGLDAMPPGTEHVLVHDGARPLVTPDLISAALAGAREHGAAICAVPVSETVKRAGEGGFVRSTVSRQGLYLAQTPQAFHIDLLRHAHGFSDIDATDDAAMVELMDAPVLLVPGSSRNIKITTPDDLALAEALLAIERA
jgi:2-C-methyl-D-erythritol 4-phosphate cytidylyltransferase